MWELVTFFQERTRTDRVWEEGTGIISLDQRRRYQEKAGENCITKGFVIRTARKMLLGLRNQEGLYEWEKQGALKRLGMGIKFYSRKPHEKEPFARPRLKWKYNIKMGLK
jgi:hypothetical protein